MPDALNTSSAAWVGRILSALVILALLADAVVALFAPQLLQGEMAATGFPAPLTRPIGIVTLVCAIFYAVPRTSVFGAVLVTGFLGGAIATHFRLNEIGSPPQLVCVLLGLAGWGGLYLRDARLRRLLPLTRSPATEVCAGEASERRDA